MEAFLVYFEITDKKGKKRTFVNKTFASTGFEAVEKSKWFVKKNAGDYKKIIFLRWKILNPYKPHFSI